MNKTITFDLTEFKAFLELISESLYLDEDGVVHDDYNDLIKGDVD